MNTSVKRSPPFYDFDVDRIGCDAIRSPMKEQSGGRAKSKDGEDAKNMFFMSRSLHRLVESGHRLRR